jgi:hypothetical protein
MKLHFTPVLNNSGKKEQVDGFSVELSSKIGYLERSKIFFGSTQSVSESFLEGFNMAV